MPVPKRMDVEVELSKYSRTEFKLAELKQKPPPEGVDPSKLEIYLSDEDFKVSLEVRFTKPWYPKCFLCLKFDFFGVVPTYRKSSKLIKWNLLSCLCGNRPSRRKRSDCFKIRINHYSFIHPSIQSHHCKLFCFFSHFCH